MAAALYVELDAVRGCKLDDSAGFLRGFRLGYSGLKSSKDRYKNGVVMTYSRLDTGQTPSFEALVISIISRE
jgi:hypothetical protein